MSFLTGPAQPRESGRRSSRSTAAASAPCNLRLNPFCKDAPALRSGSALSRHRTPRETPRPNTPQSERRETAAHCGEFRASREPGQRVSRQTRGEAPSTRDFSAELQQATRRLSTDGGCPYRGGKRLVSGDSFQGNAVSRAAPSDTTSAFGGCCSLLSLLNPLLQHNLQPTLFKSNARGLRSLSLNDWINHESQRSWLRQHRMQLCHRRIFGVAPVPGSLTLTMETMTK